MSNYKSYLSELDVYPPFHVIEEASSFAQDKVTAYVKEVDENAEVTVDEGDVYVKSDSEFEELAENAQAIFDEEFSTKIDEWQDALPVKS